MDAGAMAVLAINQEKEDPAAMTAAKGLPRARRGRRAEDATRRDTGQEIQNALSEMSQSESQSGYQNDMQEDAARLDAVRPEMPEDVSSQVVCRGEAKAEDAEEAGGRQAISRLSVTRRMRRVWWPSERRLEKRSR